MAAAALDDLGLRAYAPDSVRVQVPRADETILERMLAALSFVSGDYRDPSTFDRLRQLLGTPRRPLFYLAIPPSMFETTVAGTAGTGLHRDGRILVEKPFGRDPGSARALNACLHTAFPEEAIFRIDHFLAKETVQNLLLSRFANSLLEPVWDRHHIASVQITLAESFDVEGRGAFYEEVGAVRDVVQNHLLQGMALLAMEPPAGAGAEALRDEKVKVFQATRALDPGQLVRGQYRGYRREPGVWADSEVETYAALRLQIDSQRWEGVPFHIRTGKRLTSSILGAVVEFRQPARLLFADDSELPPHPNHLRFRLEGPGEGASLTLQAKAPGELTRTLPVDLGFTSDQSFGDQQMHAYERLLGDAIEGQAALFARQDGVEEEWRIVAPALDTPGPAEPYDPGSWGPVETDVAAAPTSGWHNPRDSG